MDNKRRIQITRLFGDEKIHSVEQLEAVCDVGNRTARKLLNEWNQELAAYGAGVRARRGEGYYLQIEDRLRFSQYEQTLKGESLREEKLPDTADGRVNFLIRQLLDADGYTRMDDICDQLYISKRALAEDLKEAKRILDRYHLKIERRPNYGIRIVGREMDLRRCMANYGNDNPLYAFKTSKDEKLGQLAELTLACLEEYGIRVSDVAFQNLIVHIFIAIQRIHSGHYVPMPEDMAQESGEKERLAAISLVERLSRQYNLEFPETEIRYIAIHLAGKRMYDAPEENQNLVITEETSRLVTDMLQSIYDSFQMDFRGDLELRMALGQHLVPLVVRIQYGMTMKNPLLQEIREQFSFPYVMAAQACGILNKRFQTKLQEDEIGYIALTLALALERKRHKKSQEKYSPGLLVRQGERTAFTIPVPGTVWRVSGPNRDLRQQGAGAN